MHGITWTDDLAWMDAMRGPKWTGAVRKEQKRWNDLIEPLKDEIAVLEKELECGFTSAHEMLFRSADGLIEGGMGAAGSIRWKLFNSDLVHESEKIWANRTDVWTVEDVGEGAELYAISLHTRKSAHHGPVWQHKGVAPSFAVVGGRCYCLEVKKKLVYWRLVSWNAHTGKDRRVHYEEPDYRYNLEIIQNADDHAYVRRQSGGKQDCFKITVSDTGQAKMEVLEGISQSSRRFIFGSKEGEYLLWTAGEGWKASEAFDAKLPDFTRAVPEQLDTRRGVLVTVWLGCRSVWSIGKRSEPVLLWKGYGSVLMDPLGGSYIRLTMPGKDCYWWPGPGAGRGPGPGQGPKGQEAGKCLMATSADGTDIPYYLLTPSSCETKPKGLLVIGYGAYGLSTGYMTHRWEPLRRRGWAIAIGLWRGGGDHTPEWADAGRCFGRSLVLEDAEAVVKAAQKAVGVPATRTVLYGRSAGGLWVGGLLTSGAVKGAAGYMEVCYLDAFQTMTNRALPLTDIEADEFGLPERDISEFVNVAGWSPMGRIPAKGLPGVFQIVRTALNDSQVYAYESMKWITRCKSPSAYLAIEGGQGHFTRGPLLHKQQAQDLAVLISKFLS
jgi:hypothetical protein